MVQTVHIYGSDLATGHHLPQTQSSQLPTASQRPNTELQDGLVLGVLPSPTGYSLCCSLAFLMHFRFEAVLEPLGPSI